MQATGIIMAGGKSSRMGTNKALLMIDGKTVIERIVQELSKTVSDILIVTNTFEEYQFLGLPMVQDQWRDMGPLAGIHAGLSASQTVKNLVVACDMPFVSAGLGGILLNLLDQYQAAVPEIDGQLHPLFAAYRKDALGIILQFLQKRELKVRQFLNHIHCKLMTEADFPILQYTFQEQHFFNMNHPEEFKKALKIAADLNCK
ncbi:molybdenum cofactor guanylyltransferase [Bacillus sp. S/N-304-OC-R1]|uniref:molybdenum cofactor guanylyltransferase n=1 Tax=Bacillus sp. S/N-304-OC-R1 TaxID=2758034 RepID=UPI001C8E4356|nr:molybdenum cofactor guanylyltransferase [Bacillus sp. S/N-304-OC-R1]MBY0123395.1 molybdenum cofactor guanylyltransferase [Bacillus sp. S/N-304-OC-R1]